MSFQYSGGHLMGDLRAVSGDIQINSLRYCYRERRKKYSSQQNSVWAKKNDSKSFSKWIVQGRTTALDWALVVAKLHASTAATTFYRKADKCWEGQSIVRYQMYLGFILLTKSAQTHNESGGIIASRSGG